jgi:hypothetical protein
VLEKEIEGARITGDAELGYVPVSALASPAVQAPKEYCNVIREL